MKQFLIITFSILSWNLNAQTEIKGGIYNDRTLSIDESPYLITGDVVLFPDKTLTIESGVEIIFQDDYYIEIRGHLKAIGTIADSIKFSTLNDSIALDSMPWMQFDWEGEKKGLVIDYPTASLKLKYCSFSKFRKALHIYNLSDTPLEIEQCKFSSNLFGLTNFSSNKNTMFDSCSFIGNSVGLYTGDATIQHANFTDNYFGIRGWYNDTLTTSSFVGNVIGIDAGSYGLIEGCTFEHNEIGVLNSWSGIEMINNTLSNNTIGIRFDLSDTTNANMIRENKICNNTSFNVENNSATNIALNRNCWCTSDSIEIEEKIYDGFDDINSGLINYDIYNESCMAVLKSVKKINIYTGIATIEELKYSIYPVPFADFINISLPQDNCEYMLSLYDIHGRIIYNERINSMENWRINTTDFNAGTYILELSGGKLHKTETLVKY